MTINLECLCKYFHKTIASRDILCKYLHVDNLEIKMNKKMVLNFYFIKYLKNASDKR